MRYKLLTLALLAAGSLACQDAAQPVKVESAKTTTMNAAPQKADAPGDHADDAPRITLADAKKDFDAGTAVFVDTRAEATYRQEHVKGAINMPMEAVETRYKEIPTGKKIIAYCS
jgi:3-mercaptopyruvate sulfurtransferase SseA